MISSLAGSCLPIFSHSALCPEYYYKMSFVSLVMKSMVSKFVASARLHKSAVYAQTCEWCHDYHWSDVKDRRWPVLQWFNSHWDCKDSTQTEREPASSNHLFVPHSGGGQFTDKLSRHSVPQSGTSLQQNTVWLKRLISQHLINYTL